MWGRLWRKRSRARIGRECARHRTRDMTWWTACTRLWSMRQQSIAPLKFLRRGGIVALPTETVYGLAADADNEDAVRKLFAAKGRPADHPVIVHVSGADALDEWAIEVPDAARVLTRAFWPGPLTLVSRRSARARDIVTGGQDTVGLRSPAHPWARALLREFGGALAAPSANSFGASADHRATRDRRYSGSSARQSRSHPGRRSLSGGNRVDHRRCLQ